jgi:hypothetical protein
MQEIDEAQNVCELSEKIKTLKATHTIEAAPQRAERKQAAAEEPVTARIRRRTGAASASEPATQPDAVAPGAGAAAPPESGESSPKTPTTFQERIAMERQRKDKEPDLL